MSSAMAKTRAALAGVGGNFWLRDVRAPGAVLEGAAALPLDLARIGDGCANARSR